MRKTAAVSFEGDSVRIVHASVRGKGITVKKTETVPENEFDNYLRREKASEFIVTCQFRESHHDIVTTPVVKEQFLRKIVESEIRKVITQKDFSFICAPVGEKVVENRKVMEVFYYAVPEDPVRNVVERFYDNGKTVSALYPSVFSAAALIGHGVYGEAAMGIFGAGKSRSAFFIKKGKIYFIRNYESFESELSDFDIQNINMTTSYCFQNLRLNPSSVFLIGALSDPLHINTMTTAPLACLSRPEYIHCDREIFNEFIVPVASFLAPKTSSILSGGFRMLYQVKNYMAYATKAFIILALLCAGAVSYEFRNMTEKKKQIQTAKKSGVDIVNVLAEYDARKEKVNKYMPVVEFLNRPSPDLQRLLISLGTTDIKGITLNKVNVLSENDNSLSVIFEGTALSDTYAAMQDSLDHMAEELVKLGNMEITRRSVELKDRTFTIEMKYKAAP
ncbi:MAG: hypothetical protein C4526_00365 [Nitrospiraceae bacterium]|nr:MAG: hypothetical protein C4526_00365 [Nitrospiraceae bacterium]